MTSAAGSLGFEVAVSIVSFAFISQKSQQEPKNRARKENSHAAQSNTEQTTAPLGEVSRQTQAMDGITGCYGPVRPSSNPASSMQFWARVGMTPSYWANLHE